MEFMGLGIGSRSILSRMREWGSWDRGTCGFWGERRKEVEEGVLLVLVTRIERVFVF